MQRYQMKLKIKISMNVKIYINIDGLNGLKTMWSLI